jgi:hypothetical protein
MSRVNITLGADPEFFIRDRETGITVPVCGLLGGTKGAPIPYGLFGLQEDNVMCEYNIPAQCDVTRFARYVNEGRGACLALLNEKYPRMYEADMAPSRIFTFEQLAHPQAAVFGCSPDYDAYQLGQPNRRIAPKELEEPRGGWRFSGGHVHIGFRDSQKFDVPAYVAAQFADVFLSLNVLRYDAQGERRKHYGTAGRYRPTPYGIEYRTLSNAWTGSVAVSEQVGSYASYLGYFLCRSKADIKRVWSEVPWQDVKRAIETEDVALAASLASFTTGLGIM